MNICLRLVYRVLLLKDIYTVFKRHEHPSLFHSLRKTDLKKLSNFKPKICWRFVTKILLSNKLLNIIYKKVYLIGACIIVEHPDSSILLVINRNERSACKKNVNIKLYKGIIFFILFWKITFYKTCQLKKLNETFIKSCRSIILYVCQTNNIVIYVLRNILVKF